MTQFAEADVYNACRLLFGSDLHVSHEFLRYLQPAGARTAFRQRAKETHPDRFHNVNPFVYRQKVRTFQDLNHAYELVLDFLHHRTSSLLPLKETVAAWSRPRPRPWTPPTAAGDRYRGVMPGRALEFGLFVYYRGLISFRHLIEALAAQRRQRPNVGDIACRWGWMTPEDIQQVLQHRSASGLYRRFGERAMELRLLDQRQLQLLLTYQRSRQRRIGEYFVDAGLVSPVQLQRLLEEHRQHNLRYSQGPLRPSF